MALKISSTRMASLSRHALLASSQSIGHFDILRIACLFPPGSKRFCFRRRFTVLSMVQTTTPADAVPMTSSQGQSSSAVTSLLEKLRSRQARDAAFKSSPKLLQQPQLKEVAKAVEPLIVSFKELGLSDELMTAVHELKLLEPTEVQSLGIPAILKGESVVIASHTGSGKTLAYMLPLVQALRRDEADSGRTMKPNRPRAIVLCPTRELAEQVFQVAKSVCHHARFRPVMISGGGRMRPQEDMLNSPFDMVICTPGRLLMHINGGNMVYGDIKYVVLDEADTMFDRGFGPEVRKILAPLKNRASQIGDKGFQTVLVTATITKAVQKLLDEEFPDLKHIHTSTLHRKVASAKHQFIRLSGTENKLEALLQVLEPSITKGNHVMVFCNTLGSCRAVDHFLCENNVLTVNYHGEVPAEERTENLRKFKADYSTSGTPTLVCTDLAARGLDLHVDHVIMFDFPLNSIDYLHRTGRTARMGAKGKVTCLVAKRDQTLAGQIEEAITRGETLEALTSSKEKLEGIKRKEAAEKHKLKLKSEKKLGVKVRLRKESPKFPRTSKPGQSRYGTKVSSGKVLPKLSTNRSIRRSNNRNSSPQRALKAR